MSDERTNRFAEYVTSGAFTMSLTRSQISMLGLIARGEPGYGSHTVAGLERRGLVVEIAKPTSIHGMERTEWRCTYVGLQIMSLLIAAGLTNGEANPLDTELRALQAEIAERRLKAADWRERAFSAISRKEQLEGELELANARIKILERDLEMERDGVKVRLKNGINEGPVCIRQNVTLRDQHDGSREGYPKLTDEELLNPAGEKNGK